MDFAWTHDSSAIVFAHMEQVRLVPLDGTEPRMVAGAEGIGDLKEWFEAVTASPTGPTVAIGGAWYRFTADSASAETAFVRVVSFDGRVIFEETGEYSAFSQPAWSPDGTRIAWAFGSDILVRAVDGDAVVRPGPWNVLGARAPVGMASGMRWSPDGTRLMFVGYVAEPLAYAIVSIAVDGPPDPRVLSPWTIELYNAARDDLSWQAVDR
jgi:Tol biopolymer transport system component